MLVTEWKKAGRHKGYLGPHSNSTVFEGSQRWRDSRKSSAKERLSYGYMSLSIPRSTLDCLTTWKLKVNYGLHMVITCLCGRSDVTDMLLPRVAVPSLWGRGGKGKPRFLCGVLL